MTLGVKEGGDTLGLGGGAGEGDDTLHWGWGGGGRFIPSPPVSFRMIISRPFSLDGVLRRDALGEVLLFGK